MEGNTYLEAFTIMVSKLRCAWELAREHHTTALTPACVASLSEDVQQICRRHNILTTFCSASTLCRQLMTGTHWRWCTMCLAVVAACHRRQRELKSKNTRLLPDEEKLKSQQLNSMPGDTITWYCGKKPGYWDQATNNTTQLIREAHHICLLYWWRHHQFRMLATMPQWPTPPRPCYTRKLMTEQFQYLPLLHLCIS